jgi:hypothetical protein
MVIVAASEAKQSPTQAERLLLSQKTLYRNDSSVVVTASEAKQYTAQAWGLLLLQRTLHRNDSSVVFTASEAKQSPAQAWRLLLPQKNAPSQRQLGYCHCERSEAVFISNMEIASVATSAPSLLLLRAKRSSLSLKHGDCFCRKECSIAMTVWLLSLRARRSSLPLKQRDGFCRNERSTVIVTANKNNAGLTQTMPFSSADVKPSAPPAHGTREYFLPGIPRFPFIFPLFSKN